MEPMPPKPRCPHRLATPRRPARAARGPAAATLLTVLAAWGLGRTAVAQAPVDLPENCSRVALTPAQEAVFERIFSLQSMAGVQAVVLERVEVRERHVEARWRVGDTGAVAHYAVSHARFAPPLPERGGVSFETESLVGWRLGPCADDAARPSAPCGLCEDRNGRAALAALHLQLQARVRGLEHLVQWWCLDGREAPLRDWWQQRRRQRRAHRHAGGRSHRPGAAGRPAATSEASGAGRTIWAWACLALALTVAPAAWWGWRRRRSSREEGGPG